MLRAPHSAPESQRREIWRSSVFLRIHFGDGKRFMGTSGLGLCSASFNDQLKANNFPSNSSEIKWGDLSKHK
ncbi:unnamed protein product [Rangifer tarandus platyrhynchus]|uniref:Uncharacterized protein n=2 Tax=Rangifer tarandus platyrhynchus TaxID=3082113 RepID=A0ABN8ZYR6_RANTA|nr:unnamed protein product [Rangifer tarandus platyrhynchus]CAI9711602.1 unnamed protein product [Rangifer tarandus platyrhynchus]